MECGQVRAWLAGCAQDQLLSSRYLAALPLAHAVGGVCGRRPGEVAWVQWTCAWEKPARGGGRLESDLCLSLSRVGAAWAS